MLDIDIQKAAHLGDSQLVSRNHPGENNHPGETCLCLKIMTIEIQW